MRLSLTLSLYLARQYTLNLLILLLALMAIIYFFDVVELTRRVSDAADVPFITILQMGLFKLPEVTQVLLPFAVLFSAIYTFWQLSQKLELVVIRSAGFSAMHFLVPIVFVALLAGFIQMSLLNPFGAYLLNRFERMEANYITKQDSQISLFADGLWLKQKTDDGYVILHSQSIKNPGWQLIDVHAFFFDEQDNWMYRMDAPSGSLEQGKWRFSKAVISRPPFEQNLIDNYVLSTYLTFQDVEDSFASPETIPFWKLPSHIRIVENSGFDTSRLRVHYNNLLSQPLMFVAMVLIAASIAMQMPRKGGGLLYISAGLGVGLLIFFISSFMQALGASQQIPVFLAAWAPAFLSFLLGMNLILHHEEN